VEAEGPRLGFADRAARVRWSGGAAAAAAAARGAAWGWW